MNDYSIQPSWKAIMRDFLSLAFGTFAGWVIVIIIAIASVSIYLMIQPSIENRQTEIIRGTHQYVEGKRQEMESNIEAFDQLAVQIALLRQDPKNGEVIAQMETLRHRHYLDVKHTASLLESTQVPANVKRFLEENE